MVRNSLVAGQFYPGDSKILKKQLDDFIETGCTKREAFGIVCPHAGYIYSGRVAGSVFARINVPDTVIILAPNHTGYGPRFSIWPDGSWSMPSGKVLIEKEMTRRLLSECNLIEKDYDAHLQEHSAEVIIPFLQYCNPKVKIAVIVIRSNVLKDLITLGEAIGNVTKNYCFDTLVVASSDMTHQEPELSVNKKDKIAIEEIIKMDEKGLHKKVHDFGITMCGVNPTVAMMVSSKIRGATTASLIKYETSGKTSGDYDHVVGYAGVIVN